MMNEESKVTVEETEDKSVKASNFAVRTTEELKEKFQEAFKVSGMKSDEYLEHLISIDMKKRVKEDAHIEPIIARIESYQQKQLESFIIALREVSIDKEFHLDEAKKKAEDAESTVSELRVEMESMKAEHAEKLKAVISEKNEATKEVEKLRKKADELDEERRRLEDVNLELVQKEEAARNEMASIMARMLEDKEKIKDAEKVSKENERLKAEIEELKGQAEKDKEACERRELQKDNDMNLEKAKHEAEMTLIRSQMESLERLMVSEKAVLNMKVQLLENEKASLEDKLNAIELKKD